MDTTTGGGTLDTPVLTTTVAELIYILSGLDPDDRVVGVSWHDDLSMKVDEVVVSTLHGLVIIHGIQEMVHGGIPRGTEE